MVESLLSLFPNSIWAKIDSEDSYKNLLSTIKDTPKPFIQQVYVVEIPEEIEPENFDAMVSNIDKEVAAWTFGKHMNALVGSEPVAQRRNLAIKPTLDPIFLQ